MPTEAPEPSMTPRTRRPVGIDPFALELLELYEKQNDGLMAEIKAFREIVDNTSKWLIRAVIGGVGSFVLGVFALVVYMVSLIASQNGADVAGAADATKKVVSTTSVQAPKDKDPGTADSPVTLASPAEPAPDGGQ